MQLRTLKISTIAASSLCIGLFAVPALMTRIIKTSMVDKSVSRFSYVATQAVEHAREASNPAASEAFTFGSQLLKGIGGDIAKSGEVSENYKVFMYGIFSWSGAGRDVVQNYQERLQCAEDAKRPGVEIEFKINSEKILFRIPPSCQGIAKRVYNEVYPMWDPDKLRL